MRMKIFIDFDDVIFNTRKFTKSYKRIFKMHGINEETYEKYYYDYPANVGKDFKKYHPGMHIRAIGKNLPIDAIKLENDIINYIKSTKKYVFRDVSKFIKQFNKKNLYLISFPDIKFQEAKIKNSGIKKYFKQSVLTSGLKSNAICKLIKKEKINKENIYFIDDRTKHIEDVKKILPKAIAILLNRKEGRHEYRGRGAADYEAKNLREVLKIINSINKQEN
jgi:FMN phosphatase YigB (HAD superfamily)